MAGYADRGQGGKWRRRGSPNPIAQFLAEGRALSDSDALHAAEKFTRELVEQSPELREITSRKDCTSYDTKWNTIMYEKIKPFVLAHKAALAIAVATIVICVLVMLAFNRYEFMNVNGNLVRVDHLTGKVMSSAKGRGSFRVVEDYGDSKKSHGRKRFEDMTDEELLKPDAIEH